MMRSLTETVAAAAIALAVCAASAGANGLSQLPSYYDTGNFNLTAPSAWTTAAGGFANPAVYSMIPGSEIEAFFSAPENAPISGLNRWGMFAGLGGLGFGFVHNRFPGSDGSVLGVTDYRLALSGGSRNSTVGLGVGWSRGAGEALGRTTIVQVGAVQRMGRVVSVGLNGTFSTQTNDQSGLFDLALRPLGDERVTLFGDLEYPKGYSLKDSPWSAGAMLEIPAGLRIIGRYFDDESFSLAFAWTLGGGVNGGRLRSAVNPRYDASSNYAGTNWGVRMGFAERNGVLSGRFKDAHYVSMDIKGPVVQTRFKYFDRGVSFYGVLDALEGARTDNRVAGVALNLSRAQISHATVWELRQKLQQLRDSGKKVVVFVDECGLATYHLASVADHIVMDPDGLMIVSGYSLGRTYMVNLIEKLGLGFEEFRFKDYKSAVEPFTRHEMSPADREQRQALVDTYYATMRADVAAGRGVDGVTVDHWIDDVTLVTAGTALKEKMVDQLASWSDIGDVVKDLEGERKGLIKTSSLASQTYPSTLWGEPHQIAVVYAVGACAMDTGINARRLDRVLRALAKNAQVKAVVLRINSPGGSAMASDVVGRAMRVCAKKKPVIVSQGDVAASGGYWISMYGDEIFAEPTTITGSIGVIGGWLWDKGFGEKLGLESDFVKAGEHADLFTEVKLPLLGIGVPHRGVTDDERTRILSEMETMYDGFIARLAKNRKLDETHVAEIAKGRVWTGQQALEIGLVDHIGGLDDAIARAKEKAGLGDDAYVEVKDMSHRGLFNPDAINPLPFAIRTFLDFGRGADGDTLLPSFLLNYDLFYLTQIAAANGRPLCLLSPDYMLAAGDPSEQRSR